MNWAKRIVLVVDNNKRHNFRSSQSPFNYINDSIVINRTTNVIYIKVAMEYFHKLVVLTQWAQNV